MHRDVGFRQKRNAGDATAGAETVHVARQHMGAPSLGRIAQQALQSVGGRLGQCAKALDEDMPTRRRRWLCTGQWQDLRVLRHIMAS